MIKVIIRNLEGQVTNSASFSEMDVALEWLHQHEAMGTWRFEELVIPAIPEDEFGRSKPEEVFPQTHVLEIISAYVDQEQINSEARAYLASTDWYIVRFMEQGTPIPMEIHEARATARARVL